MVDQREILGIHVNEDFKAEWDRFFLRRRVGHVGNEDISFDLMFDEVVDHGVDIGFELDE